MVMIVIVFFVVFGGVMLGCVVFMVDVCYGASWESTATATKAFIGKIVKLVIVVLKEYLLFVDVFVKVCLDVGNVVGNMLVVMMV